MLLLVLDLLLLDRLPDLLHNLQLHLLNHPSQLLKLKQQRLHRLDQQLLLLVQMLLVVIDRIDFCTHYSISIWWICIWTRCCLCCQISCYWQCLSSCFSSYLCFCRICRYISCSRYLCFYPNRSVCSRDTYALVPSFDAALAPSAAELTTKPFQGASQTK